MTNGLETIVFAMLLALIPLRAVLSEIHTFETPRGLRFVDAPPTASPATTFALISLICAAAGVTALLRGVKATRPLRTTGAELGALILLAAMAWSTLHAGQKHLALIASLDTATAILYGLTLRQYLDSPSRIRLTLAVVLATGVMVIGKCAYQRWVEWPDTLEFYRQHKDELLAQGRTSEGFIHDYERRLESGAVTGFFHHPNVLASYLLLVIFAAFAAISTRGNRRSATNRPGETDESRNAPPPWSALMGPALIVTAALVALAAAQSKGAMAALAVGLLVWCVSHAARAWLRARPRAAVASIWLTLVFIAGAVVATLSYKPDALGRSMLFRWLYWKGAAAMIADRGLGGIGGGNFGRYFTIYKPPICPEDVEDPHSWVVRGLVDWGVPGLAGLVLAFVGISWKAAQSAASRVEPTRLPADVAPARPPSMILWSAAIAVIFMAGWTFVLRTAGASYLLLTFHVPLIGWFAGSYLAAPRSTDDHAAYATATRGLLAPLAAGLYAFVLHSGIDLAMFLSGPATTFFALAAVMLAAASSEVATIRGRPVASRRTTWLAGGLLLLVAAASILMTLAIPAARAARGLNAARVVSPARTYAEYTNSPPGQAYRRAIDAYRLDATAIDEYAEELSDRVQRVAEVDEVLALIREFERRDPHNASIAQHRATLYYQRFALTAGSSPPSREALDDLDRAVQQMRLSVAAYPSHPGRRVQLAELLARRADAADRPTDRREAADELEKALELDEQRIYVSAPHRFSSETRESLRRRMSELRAE